MLLVPVALDALILRSPGGTWARTAMRAPDAPPGGGHAGRQQLLPTPFADLDEDRAPGAYLHWALADALTRLEPGDDGEATLPAVPSRWLVLRLSGPAAAHRRLDAWLLPNVHAEQPEMIANALSLTDPVPPGEVAQPMTAAGHGDLAWSAYFDNVEGRLALHDPLDDVTGPVAYLVCGWYTHGELDPLQPPGESWSEGAFRERLADLGWYAEGPVPDPIPTRSLYHGSAVAIAWPGTTWTGDGGGELSAERGGPPDPANVDVAIGETVAAAVTRLTARDAQPLALSRLVEGLAVQALGELAEADGTSRLVEALHASRFGEVPRGGRRETIYRPPELLAAAPAAPAGGRGDGRAGEGDLLDAVAAVAPSDADPAGREAAGDGAGRLDAVDRSAPRLFHPVDPSLAVSGARRSFRHGGDDRHDPRGLRCRHAGRTVTALGPAGGPPVSGGDVVPEWDVPGTPPPVRALLDELASLDPGSAPDLEGGETPSPIAAARAAWWTSWDPEEDDETPGYELTGEPPCPLAVTPPSRPWTPLHLDWEVAWRPSPRGAHDWRLGEVDYEPPEDGPVLGGSRTIRGRAPLTPGGAEALAGLDPELTDLDVLTGVLEGFLDRVRGVPEGQLVLGDGDERESPYPVTPLRAGGLELRRLRVVDTYGQVIDLLGSSASQPVDPDRLGIHEDLEVPGRAGLVAQVPRFTAPARILLRYVDVIDGEEEAGPGVSPLCGFLVPTPVDRTLGFLDADGRNLGRLVPEEDGSTAWEEDPGLPAAMGRLPSRLIGNATLGALGDGVVASDTAPAGADGESALAALLRVIDTTRSTVDDTSVAGDAHLALLLGRPVAVLRARLTLEVDDPAAGEENARTSVAVRLGSLAHLDDGLLGYYAREDFSRLHAIDPAVSELAPPLPGGDEAGGVLGGGYVDPSGVVWVHPGRPVELALLLAPGAAVRVTTGLLPVKAIGVRREWLDAWLAKLTPTLRAGPVLRDPRSTRLPVPEGIRGTWTWYRRPEPGAWTGDPVTPATGNALLPDSAPLISDGWLRARLAAEAQFLPLAVPFRVTCTDRASGARITAVGGENPDGSHWKMPVGQAVRMIESRRFRFYVEVDGFESDVVVRVSVAGRKYLRTRLDDVRRNNLLSLPSCPK